MAEDIDSVACHAEPEFSADRIVVARFIDGKRQGVFRMTPEAGLALATELQSAAMRVINKRVRSVVLEAE